MNQQQAQWEMDDVLDAYAASDPGPSHAALMEWIRRYPQYERELTDFTVSWSVLKWLPPPAEGTETAEDLLVLRGMSVVQNLLHSQSAEQPSIVAATPFASLLAESKIRGLEGRQLANALRLSAALVRKLDRRLIRAESIPTELVQIIASTMQREVMTVARYFQGAPALPHTASYLADHVPTLGEPEDFFDAVQRDLSLSEEDRQYWLAIARPQPPDGTSAS